MPDTPDVAAAIADLDDDYLQVQLLLAVRRAGAEEPRRGAMWHALAGLLASEQQRRSQSTQLLGESGASVEVGSPRAATLEMVREELRRDAEALEAEFADLAGDFPNPAGQAPLVEPDQD